MAIEPAGAPICWGKQFQDGDDECGNCNFNSSCRPATLNGLNSMQYVRRNGSPSLPQYVPPSPPQYTAPRFGAPTLPQPSNYPRVPQMPTIPQHQVPQMPHQPQQPASYHQPYAPPGWNVPIAYLPRPNPANPAWWQYAGETTKSRLGKNVLLSALQAIFAELLRFFANWTWPASPSTT